MRIAIPVKGSAVAASLTDCDGYRFYEDDHGKVVKAYTVPFAGGSVEDALRLVEPYSVDALVTPLLDNDARREVMLAGLLLNMTASGEADDAALAYLRETIAFDPANTCNACGHGHECTIDYHPCEEK